MEELFIQNLHHHLLLIQAVPENKSSFDLEEFRRTQFPEVKIIRGRMKLGGFPHITVMMSKSGTIQSFVKAGKINDFLKNPEKEFRPFIAQFWSTQPRPCPTYSFETVNLQSSYKINHCAFPFRIPFDHLVEHGKTFGFTISYKDVEQQNSILIKDLIERTSSILNVHSHTITAKAIDETLCFLLSLCMFMDDITDMKLLPTLNKNFSPL